MPTKRYTTIEPNASAEDASGAADDGPTEWNANKWDAEWDGNAKAPGDVIQYDGVGCESYQEGFHSRNRINRALAFKHWRLPGRNSTARRLDGIFNTL